MRHSIVGQSTQTVGHKMFLSGGSSPYKHKHPASYVTFNDLCCFRSSLLLNGHFSLICLDLNFIVLAIFHIGNNNRKPNYLNIALKVKQGNGT